MTSKGLIKWRFPTQVEISTQYIELKFHLSEAVNFSLKWQLQLHVKTSTRYTELKFQLG